MKIKKLIIKNIASIEDAEIDFENGALANEPLFLITGETGSGKTTILNAICLALYNTAPSLEEVQNAQKAARISGLTIDDPRQMVRQGANEAHVILDFDGNDANPYRIKWQTHRARKSGDFQAVDLTLLNVKTGVQEVKLKEVKKQVSSAHIVGLTYEQFCRTTMLAQGQFSKFMKSADADKASILEKLTGTEIYAEIGQKINERYKDATAELDRITQLIEGAKLLSEDERKEMNDNIKRASAQLKLQEEKIEILKVKNEWLKDVEKNRSDQTAKNEELTQLLQKKNSESAQQQRSTISLWRRTSEIRARMNDKVKTENDLMGTRNSLASKRIDFEHYVAGLNYLRQEEMELGKNVVSLQNKLKGETPHQNMYDNSQRIVSYLETAQEQRRIIQENEQFLQQSEQTEQKMQQALTQAQNEAQRYEQIYLDAKKVTLQKKEAANDVDLISLSNNVAQAEQHRRELCDAQNRLENYRKQVKQTETAQNDVADLQKQIADATEKERVAEQNMEIAEKEADAYENQYKGKLDLRNTLVEIQQRFRETKKCPLCGSQVEGIHSETELDKAVAEARELSEKSKRQFKELQKTVAELKSSIVSNSNSLIRAQEIYNNAKCDANKAENSVNELLNNYGLSINDENIDRIICTKIAEYQDKQKDAKERLQEGQSKKEAIEPARRNEEFALRNRDNALKIVQAKQNEKNAYVLKVNEKRTITDTAQRQLINVLDELKALISIEVDWSRVDFLALKSLIIQKTNHYHELQNSLLNLQKNKSDNEKLITSINSDIIQLEKILGKCNTDGTLRMNDLANSIHSFYQSVTGLSARQNEEDKRLNLLTENIHNYFETNSDIMQSDVDKLSIYNDRAIEAFEQEQLIINENEQKCKGALQQIEKDRAHLLDIKPHFEPNEERADYISAELLKAIKEKDELNNSKIKDETLLADDMLRRNEQEHNIKKREQVNALCNDWKILNDCFGGKDGGRFKSVAQSYVLRSLLQKANYYLLMLSSRYELFCSDGSLSISILDNFQGGVERNVSSLSGGEGFVVSLALALGLSAISQEKINVDTLFIDEGFGTLSRDYLETVLQTLDKLHQLGGRRVGVISHVTELANRIPTQIRLKRTGPSSSKVVISS